MAITGGDGSTATGAAPTAGARATVAANQTTLGKVLADSHDRTLYLFEKDTHGKSACSGACTSAWPPLLTRGKPITGSGASSSLLGTTARPGGARQVTYDGHPLYYYAGDEVPGQTNGQGLDQFGAAWFVISPTGRAITSGDGGGGVY
jgi:predicted lipoprotein with Yx(FWY)xxD motif